MTVEFDDLLHEAIDSYTGDNHTSDLGLPIQSPAVARGAILSHEYTADEIYELFQGAYEYYERNLLERVGGSAAFVNLVLRPFLAIAIEYEMGIRYQGIFGERMADVLKGLPQSAE